jgi:hypothetical protein
MIGFGSVQIQYRNLWVAASGGMHGSTKCSAAGCNEEEKQEHLVRCLHTVVIRREFWDKIAALMRDGETQDERRVHGPEMATRNQGRRHEGRQGRSGDDLLGMEEPLRGSDAGQDRRETAQPKGGVRELCTDGLHTSGGVWSQVVQMVLTAAIQSLKLKRFRSDSGSVS